MGAETNPCMLCGSAIDDNWARQVFGLCATCLPLKPHDGPYRYEPQHPSPPLVCDGPPPLDLDDAKRQIARLKVAAYIALGKAATVLYVKPVPIGRELLDMLCHAAREAKANGVAEIRPEHLPPFTDEEDE